MKNVLFFTISLISAINLFAQNVGIGTNTPDASAKLDVVDANRGLLIPRVALTATNASGPVTSPATSLLVYNTATAGTAPNNVWPGFYYWDGAKWVRLDTGNGDWKLDGNTNGTLRYIGTNDNFDFPIYTNGTEKMRVTTAGNVGIGTTNPTAKLHVFNSNANAEVRQIIGFTNVGGPTTGRAVLSLDAPYGSDLHLIAQGGTASTFAGVPAPFAGIASVWRDLVFSVTNNGLGAERMRITTNGNVGIGTTNPSQKLQVNGNIYSLNYVSKFIQESTLANNNYSETILSPVGQGAQWAINAAYTGSGSPLTNMVYKVVPGPYNTGAGLLRFDGNTRDWAFYVAPTSTGVGNPVSFTPLLYLSNSQIWFSPTGTNSHFFINSLGNVGIGTTTPRTRLDVPSKNSGIQGNGTSQDGPTNAIIEAGTNSNRYNDWNNGWIGGLSTWDIVGASTKFNGYITRSDRAYKTNISSIEADPNFVQKFMQLNPVTYNFNRETIQADEPDYQRLHYGFIANEVEKLFPDIVANAGLDPSIKRGLEYDAFIPMLVKIVQNQQKTIENLQQENTSLKSLQQENTSLKSELQELKNELDHLKAYVGLKSQK